MTTLVNVHEAKTKLSQLLARAESGEDIVIARAGRPVVRLEPYRHSGGLRTGFLDVTTPADFFEPMSNEELAEWE